jgi:hypothetical protein
MKPTPEEVLARIFEQVELDKINQEVEAMTDGEIAKELEAEGYTQAKIDKAFEKQQKMLDELEAEEKRQRRQQVLSYVGGVATAAAVTLAVRATTTTTPTGPVGPTATATAAKSPAEVIRSEAFEACGRGRWDECARRLDEAKKLDPDGENDPDVRNARRLLESHR